MQMKDSKQTSRLLKTVHRNLQNLTENYKTNKIDIEIQHAKALKKLGDDYKRRSDLLKEEIESMGQNLAS